MFGFSRKADHREIGPLELQEMLAADQAMLIDVREANEFAQGHIAGAINVPLSNFDPASLPDAGGRIIVLQCAGGKRSGTALARCTAARAAIDTHLGGGLGAWRAAGLPTIA